MQRVTKATFAWVAKNLRIRRDLIYTCSDNNLFMKIYNTKSLSEYRRGDFKVALCFISIHFETKCTLRFSLMFLSILGSPYNFVVHSIIRYIDNHIYTELAKCWCFCVPCTSFRVDPQWPDLTCYRSKLENRIPKVDLPEIKGNHRKFRNLVTSYIGNSVYVCVHLSIFVCLYVCTFVFTLSFACILTNYLLFMLFISWMCEFFIYYLSFLNTIWIVLLI